MKLELKSAAKTRPFKFRITRRALTLTFIALATMPTIVSAAETWHNLNQNHPVRGLIGPGPLSIGNYVAFIGGGIDKGIINGSRLHIQAATGYGEYCTQYQPTKMAADFIRDRAGDEMSMVFRGYAAAFGWIGGTASGAAHGAYMVGREILSGGHFTNQTPCALRAEQMVFDGLTPAWA